MTSQSIIDLITTLGFKQEDPEGKIYAKRYPSHNDYLILLDFEKGLIDYGRKIIREDETTSNFSKPENFVVLECVNHLLEKGYKPEDLTLEKRWKLGRTGKSGKADITIKNNEGKTVLIIECKTAGKEFEDEKIKMQQTGGQLFSYLQQDKNTRYLCLYTSHLGLGNVEYENAIVKVEDTEYAQAGNVSEMLKVWQDKGKGKKEFLPTGIFEDDVEPYNPGFVPLRIKDLKDFGQDDAKKVYGEFEEILRHNNISDRSNAFNRFISLVLAKIVDEAKSDEAMADFQIKEGIDTSYDLQERLQTLYTIAMKEYLGETVINYTMKDIEEELKHFPRQTSKEKLEQIYKELKFYANNEFAFKEIYNEGLFEQNAKVLFEVVRLFQKYRFKYTRKAQFLGDFFEDMLESGFKQTEGQFFTPTPIAKFIISSIPLKEIIEEKVKRANLKILPFVIDYACGSGHFLTEAIEEIQQIIQQFDDTAHKDIKRLKESTEWAGDYLCGIEKDYRLARTSQVACFMHGDGDARIIFGDGLEEHSRMPAKQYDVLVANPPYSIKDFARHLNREKLPSYELLKEFEAKKGREIEVLFAERTKQLLKVGGYAGIFMPSSILTNSGVYTKAREILLKYFEIKAICEFGSNTFSATPTNTVVLFMKRRDERFAKDCRYIAEDFILGIDYERRNDFIDSQNFYKRYTALIGIPHDDYVSLTKYQPSETLKQTEFYQTYRKHWENRAKTKNLYKRFAKLEESDKREKLEKDWYNFILQSECEKFEYFLLTHTKIEDKEQPVIEKVEEEIVLPDGNKEIRIKVFTHYRYTLKPQQTLIIKSGKNKKTQKAFLGYTFSKRRGYKGLDFDPKRTKLYDQNNQHNPEKVNSYIYKAFLDESITTIHEKIADHISLVNLVDCFNFERVGFEKQVNLSAENKRIISPKYPLKPIESILLPIKGAQTKIVQTRIKASGKLPVISQEKDFISGYTDEKIEPITDLPLIVFGDHTTIFKYVDFPFVRGADGVKLLKPNDKFIPKAFYYLCQAIEFEANQEYTRHYKYLAKCKIPLPPKEVQEQIIKEIEEVEREEKEAEGRIEQTESTIWKMFEGSLKNAKRYKFSQIASLEYGASLPEKARITGEYPVMGSNGIVGYHSQYLIKGPAVIVGRKGSAGKVTFIDKDCYPIDTTFYLTVNPALADLKFMYYYLRKLNLENLVKQMGVPGLNRNDVYDLDVNLPDKTIQQKIIKEVESLEAQISKAEAVLSQAQEKKRAILNRYLL